MGLFGGGPNIAKSASEKAAKAIHFAPKSLDVAGIGGIDVTKMKDGKDQDFEMSINLPENVRAIQESLFGAAPGALEAAGGAVPGAGAASEQMIGQGQQALGALGSFDPLQAAQDQFNKLEGILAPTRERESAALQARLHRQGLLQGTAGDRAMGERGAAIERERQLALLNQFQAAGQEQSRLAGLGTGLVNQGMGVSNQLFGRGLGAAQGAQSLAAPAMQLAGLSSDLGQAKLQGQIAKSGAIGGHNTMMQAGDSGGGLGEMLGGAIKGGIGGFMSGGPMGGLFGAGLGGATGSAHPGGVGGLFTPGGGGAGATAGGYSDALMNAWGGG